MSHNKPLSELTDNELALKVIQLDAEYDRLDSQGRFVEQQEVLQETIQVEAEIERRINNRPKFEE